MSMLVADDVFADSRIIFFEKYSREKEEYSEKGTAGKAKIVVVYDIDVGEMYVKDVPGDLTKFLVKGGRWAHRQPLPAAQGPDLRSLLHERDVRYGKDWEDTQSATVRGITPFLVTSRRHFRYRQHP
ncbi:hypothetical protein ACFWA1_35980 [Streptomyces sp. NPDC060005]|uniref:hypothetical protein n=1 Tax=Streptomyces sp. NPDC060005 TaxID=3347034 RepID=UPI003678B5A8